MQLGVLKTFMASAAELGYSPIAIEARCSAGEVRDATLSYIAQDVRLWDGSEAPDAVAVFGASTDQPVNPLTLRPLWVALQISRSAGGLTVSYGPGHVAKVKIGAKEFEMLLRRDRGTLTAVDKSTAFKLSFREGRLAMERREGVKPKVSTPLTAEKALAFLIKNEASALTDTLLAEKMTGMGYAMNRRAVGELRRSLGIPASSER